MRSSVVLSRLAAVAALAVGLSLSPADGFVVSRMDGRSSVAEILRISPLAELDALRSIKRLLGAKVIDFPSRLRA